MQITNNVTYLTDDEKVILSKAAYYSYVYGVGLIFIHLSEGSQISWNCSNSIAAKEYLENLGVQELE